MLTNILQCFWQFQDNVHSIYYCILSSKTILGYLDIDIVAIIIIISSAWSLEGFIMSKITQWLRGKAKSPFTKYLSIPWG